MLQLDPNEAEIVLVAEDEALEAYSAIWDTAYICAIDAEWQPNQRIAKATLVQLAIRDRRKKTLILLLDLLALSQEAVKSFLQALFRRQSVLKLGYGLSSDLKAIRAALGPTQGSCTAVVKPVIELRILIRYLRRECPQSAPKTKGPGLSGLIEGALGETLDKKLQCSSWGSRPLTAQQMEYAALDAACLLSLLEAYTSLCIPKPQDDSIPADEASLGFEKLSLHHPYSSVGCNLSSGKTGLLFQSPHISGEAVLAATKEWGCRVEMSGDSLSYLRMNGELVKPLNDADHLQGAFFPSIIPWEASRLNKDSESAAEPKFVADTAQEGLARQLRMCGFDTQSSPEPAKGCRHHTYRFLLNSAASEGRVILTCDRNFMNRRLSNQAFFVQGKDKKAQLKEVIAAFNLEINNSKLLSRCAKCNGKFIGRPFKFQELPSEAAKQVEANRSMMLQDIDFWVCEHCSHVYWRGSQFERCLSHLSQRLQSNA